MTVYRLRSLRHWILAWAWMLGAFALLTPGHASGQEAAPSAADVQTFEPALGPHGLFTVESASTLEHLRPWASATLHYASEPLVLDREGTRQTIVDQQFGLGLGAAMGLWGRLQIGAHLPFYPANEVRVGEEARDGPAFGDLSVRAKARLLDRRRRPIGIGLALDATAPTGYGRGFVGEPGPTTTPELLVDTAYGRWAGGANIGVRFQSSRDSASLPRGHALAYRLGAEYRAVPGRLALGLELYGRTPLSDIGSAPRRSPMELLLGADVGAGGGIVVSAGAGARVVDGAGAPEFRTFFEISYPDVDRDPDADGLGADDACPHEAEDPDGFEDLDGCPDPDNDGDGVPDTVDRCPDTPGLEAQNGCPPPQKEENDDTPPESPRF